MRFLPRRMGVPRVSRWLVLIGGILVAYSMVALLVNFIVKEPYMDEIFHVPQAQQYCRGDFFKWDPMITTLPGLYYIAIALISPLYPLARILSLTSSFSALCSLPLLRFCNVLLSLACLPLFFHTTRLACPLARRGEATLKTAIFVLFPLHWFFAFLFYTDVASTAAVLAMYSRVLNRSFNSAALLGAVAVFIRQTNIVWVLFSLCVATVFFLKEEEEGGEEEEHSVRFGEQQTWMGDGAGGAAAASAAGGCIQNGDHSIRNSSQMAGNGEEDGGISSAISSNGGEGLRRRVGGSREGAGAQEREGWDGRDADVGEERAFEACVGEEEEEEEGSSQMDETGKDKSERFEGTAEGEGQVAGRQHEADYPTKSEGRRRRSEWGGDGWGRAVRASVVAAWFADQRKPLNDELLSGLLWVATRVWQHRLKFLVVFFPFLFILFAFGVFVLQNGGIVVGARDAHKLSPHFMQPFYFSTFSFICLLPFHISFSNLFSQIRNTLLESRTHPMRMAAKATALLLCSILVVRYFSIAHPYLLADNRHYTFYIWRRIIDANPFSRFLLIPLHGLALTSTLSNLRRKEGSLWTLLFAMASSAVLVPSPLLEFRYFIIPFSIMLMHFPIPSTRKLVKSVMIIAGFSLVNLLTMSLFLFRPFIWEGHPGLQRFMW